MSKFYSAFVKEILLLRRDLGGIIIIFVMPLALVIVVTMIQDATFKNMEGAKLPVVVVDKDKGEISHTILKTLAGGSAFRLIAGRTEKQARTEVFGGKYQLAIVIPEGFSENIDLSIHQKVEKIVSNFGAPVLGDSLQKKPVPQIRQIRLYFDPAANLAFKENIKTAISKMAFEIENKKIYSAFQQQLGVTEPLESQKDLINFKEIVPQTGGKELRPNTVQHNIPAWALFAMFFIVLPLSVSLIKEKNQGTAIRLQISPTPYYIHFFGKIAVYLLICICQFLMMLFVGKFIFPFIGLPAFEVGGQLLPMLVVTFFSALAAVGFGILLGTLTTTMEQSSALGATAVVILAAIGGIWLPVFMMPKMMQAVSRFSPMNWGLEAYYDIILRHAALSSVLPQLFFLFLFFAATVLISTLYERKRNCV